MSAYPQSRKQSLASLQRANMLRLERTKIKAEIGGLPRCEAFGLLADILECPPACCERATAFELLKAVDRVGRHYALTWLRRAGVQEGRHLRELTERQRFCLAGLLRAGESKVAA